MRALLLLAVTGCALTGCALSSHPTVPADLPLAPAEPGPTATLEEALTGVGPVEVESVVSARWTVPLGGILNLEHPDAVAAGFVDGPTDIVLPVHVLRHPDHGVFIVDTGVSRRGILGTLRGPVRWLFDDGEVVEPLESILARQPAPLAGVLLTHAHVDHVLGLAAVPPDVPIYAGPGELEATEPHHPFLRATYQDLLDGRPPLRTLSWGPEDEALAALDLFGDGSVWALHAPGHTDGSVAFVVRSPQGPVLLLGDVSHTRWGWEHGVEPGTFTADHDRHTDTLARLRALADRTPELRVFTGHDPLDYVGEGVSAAR